MRANTRSSVIGSILHSYATELGTWVRCRATRYGTACGIMVAGAISILIAVGVATAAAFHFIELRYGISVAYGTTGGFFFLLGLAGLLGGHLLLKNSAAPLPRPQADMLKRSIAVPVAARLLSSGASLGAAGRADPATQALAAGAAIMLVGWIVASRIGRRSVTALD